MSGSSLGAGFWLDRGVGANSIVRLQRQSCPELASHQLRGMLPRLLAEMVRVIIRAFGGAVLWVR